MPDGTAGVTATLTDGTGISRLLGSKILKDLVLDAVLSAPIALAAVNVNNLESAVAAPLVAFMALGDALIRVGFRAIVRWAQS
jgi:ABC-type antimicrobial peptide transport system permease subunit